MVKILKAIEEEVGSWTPSNYLNNTVFLLIALTISTAVHEAGHIIVSSLVGCPAGLANLSLLQGAMSFSCEAFTGFALMWRQIAIGYAGGLTAILLGVFFWFSEVKPSMERGELSNVRLFCVILFFLSGLFQLCPLYSGLDGGYVVSVGMPLWAAWGVWVFLVSLVANIIISEPKKKQKDVINEGASFRH